METNPHPPLFELANYRRTPGKLQKVRVLVPGWFGSDHKPVEVGQEFSAPADDASVWRGRGMVEYVK